MRLAKARVRAGSGASAPSAPPPPAPPSGGGGGADASSSRSVGSTDDGFGVFGGGPADEKVLGGLASHVQADIEGPLLLLEATDDAAKKKGLFGKRASAGTRWAPKTCAIQGKWLFFRADGAARAARGAAAPRAFARRARSPSRLRGEKS